MSVPPPAFDSWFRSRHPAIRLDGALAALRLAAAGATLPFIARYRKDETFGLDEVAIEEALGAKELWDRILSRQTVILESIERQKKLTPELREKVQAAFDPDTLEDLYLPYKQKRKSPAVFAREAGLEPLADWIWSCGHGTEEPQPGQTLELWAFTFRAPERGVATAEAAIEGARDLLVERLAETPELRARVRAVVLERGHLHAGRADKAKANSKYEHYFDHHESLASLRQGPSRHRYLVLRRGAAEEELTLSIAGPPGEGEFAEGLVRAFEAAACTVPGSPGAAVLRQAAHLAFTEHVLPGIASEVHRDLKEAADEAAIALVADGVRRLLLAAPFGARPALGVDPGPRAACTLAAVDAAGAYKGTEAIDLRSDEGKARARGRLAALTRGVSAEAVAVGNGPTGREAEIFVRRALREEGLALPVVLVSEAGASLYAASEEAREELPDLDAAVRRAISIARRLQDPLAELGKVDPRSLGGGVQHPHDVSACALQRRLERVVDSCVNQVGVNLNTTSTPLLARVSGVGPALARAIVLRRARSGPFGSRAELLEVPGFGPRSFEQAAGFLRVPGGAHPLDNTGIHPERYAALAAAAARLGRETKDLLGPGADLVRPGAELRDAVGAFTFEDIVRELEKPGRDPRGSFVPFSFREDLQELADLEPGMVCPGIVTNVTDFGAFVDVGVRQDGLVHISQLGARFVKDPREAVRPGDRVEVRVLQVSLDKKQFSLSMKPAPPPRPAVRASRPGRPPAARRPPAANRPAPPPDKRPTPPPASRDATRGRSAPDRKPPARTERTVAFNNPFAVLAKLKEPKR